MPPDDDRNVGEPREERRPAADELLRLFDAALPQVYGYLLRRCGDRTSAEELTSETFLAAATTVRSDPSAPVTIAWLIGVARHKLVDHWRRREREQRALRAVAGSDDDVDDPWEARLDAMRASTVLASLPPEHRTVLVLRYLDGLPVSEVADLLDRTVQATEALLTRAKRAFRAEYLATEEGDRD